MQRWLRSGLGLDLSGWRYTDDPHTDVISNVHGIRNGLGWIGTLQRRVDWTKGCIALTDDEIDEVWNLVPDGTPIEIDH